MSDNDEVKKKLKDWLRNKCLEWQKETDNIGNVSKFAKWIDPDISQQNMNRWINGQALPTGKFIQMLANRLGNEVYDILGEGPLPDDERLKNIVRNWDKFPEGKKDELARNALKGQTQNGQTTKPDHRGVAKPK